MHRGGPGMSGITASRLWATLQQYAQFGATPEGGVTRPIFSPADVMARRQLVEDCQALGLDTIVDAAANVRCVRAGSGENLPTIMIGSHLDTVPDGGRYDGAFGVICGLEIMRALVDSGRRTRHPITLVSFTGEEATAYGTSTFGSRAMVGQLPDVAAGRLPDGRTVREALGQSGGNWDRLESARLVANSVACFLEAHIEQGKRLEDAGRPLGVVSGVCGIHRQRVAFRGEAGHAGTTAMGGRHDALRAAARFVLAIAELPAKVASSDPAATATVGFIEVAPNTPNVIPGRASVATDLRTSSRTLLSAMASAAIDSAREAAAREATEVDIFTTLDQDPIAFDGTVRSAMRAAVRRMGGGEQELASQAGHDAVHLQALAPTGMLFVRCAGGISHHPGESMTPEDAALATEVLLETLLELDQILDS